MSSGWLYSLHVHDSLMWVVFKWRSEPKATLRSFCCPQAPGHTTAFVLVHTGEQAVTCMGHLAARMTADILHMLDVLVLCNSQVPKICVGSYCMFHGNMQSASIWRWNKLLWTRCIHLYECWRIGSQDSHLDPTNQKSPDGERGRWREKEIDQCTEMEGDGGRERGRLTV